MVATTNEAYRLDVNVQESGAAEQDVLIYGFNAQDQVVINKTTDAQGDVTTTNIEVAQYDDDGVSPSTTIRTPIRLRALKFGFFFREQELVPSARLAATFFISDNTTLTESVQATIDAYTGITYNDVSDLITLNNTGGTPVNNVERLYDRTHSRYTKAANQQPGFGEIIASSDKQNYIYEYDIEINAASFVFDGQGRAFSQGNVNARWSTINGGRVSDITVDVLQLNAGSAGLTFNDVNVTSELNFDVAGNYTWDGGNITGDIVNNAGVVNLTLVNGATFTGTATGTGTTNIIQSVPIFVKCIDESGANIEGVNIILGTGPGLTDVVDNVLTDVNGEINETYSGSTPDTAEGFAAKGTQVPTFKRAPLSGAIAAGTGYTQTITLISDD